MTKSEITYSQALSLALGDAREVLRELFPADEANVFERPARRYDNFWLFFVSRKIKMPDQSDGTVADNCAYAVGQYGRTLNVPDNFYNNEALAEQVAGLSQYFAEHDR